MGLQEDLHKRLSALATSGPFCRTKVFQDLAKISGVSQTRIRYFYDGQRPNLMPNTLDELAEAVTIYERLHNGK